MKHFASIEAAAGGPLKGAALCLGNFDGVHVGHRALIAAAARHGPPAVLTFEPHPGAVLQPSLAPRRIATPARKLELLEAAGVATAVVQPFSRDYASTTPAEFEHSLFVGLGVQRVVVGGDFTYGARRAGTVATLTAAAERRGASVDVVPTVSVDGLVVSSSHIREYVLEGRVEAAARLLGRPFDLDGTVVTGAGRGRTIGFPTANVDTSNELRPGPGVYAVAFRIGATWRGGAANIGVKPTFGGTTVTIEVHLLDFAGDLYASGGRLAFIERLRAEQRFASVQELTAQIARDVEAARSVIAATSMTF